MKLGYIDTAIKAATALMDSQGGAAPRSAPRAQVPSPAPAGGPTTVSPVMQQAFTPQFSPVMTMQQDSPGAHVTATPTQTASPGQTARTMPGQPIPGAYPGSDYGDWPAPLRGDRGPAFPEAFPDPYARPAIHVADEGVSDLMKTGLFAIAAIGAIKLLGNRKKPQKSRRREIVLN